MKYSTLESRKYFYPYFTKSNTGQINIKTIYNDYLITGTKLYKIKGRFAKVKVYQYFITVKFYRDDQTQNNPPHSVLNKYVFLNRGVRYAKTFDNNNFIFKNSKDLIYINLEDGYFEVLNLTFKNFKEINEFTRIIEDFDGNIWKSVKGNRFEL